MFAPWQVLHPELIPRWLNCALPKVVMLPLAPASGISVEGTLLMWQFSQAAVVGTCCGLSPFMDLGLTPKRDALPLWQVAHPAEIPEWLKAELLNLAPS